MDIRILEIDSFVRSVGVNRGSPHALFVGAGASITSGVPSANGCIWQWKRSIFCTRNPGLEDQVNELTLPAVQNRIQRWLTINGIAPTNGNDEYSYFIEACLPISDDRRRYFESWIRKARPHVGYQLLCLLAESGLVQSVWTTNFDGLVARAASNCDLSPIEVGIDCPSRILRQPNRGELLCVSLHGDYRYDSLKNTGKELQQQEASLVGALISMCGSCSLIVSGYSGRDASLMQALRQAIVEQPFSGKLYWCGFSEEPADGVANLLKDASDAGREAYYVPDASFDDIMVRLGLYCLEKERLDKAKEIIGERAAEERLPRVCFSVPHDEPTTIIKSNAWAIQCPAEMFAFDLLRWPTEHVWRWLTEKTAKHNVIAVPKKTVLAFGTLDGIHAAFDGEIKGEVQRVPVTEKDIRYDDGAVLRLMRSALVRSMAEVRELGTDGRELLWKSSRYKTEEVNGQVFDVHEAARLSLRRIAEQLYVTLDPTIHVAGDGVDKEVVRAIRYRILGYQHNREFNAALKVWRKLLLEEKQRTEFEFPAGSGAFRFVIRSAPAFAAIRQTNTRPLVLPDGFSRHFHHFGIEVPEPNLRFGTRSVQRRGLDTMPIRGLVEHGPFDDAFRMGDGDDCVNVAVVCPRAEAPMLESFLSECSRTHQPPRGTKEEYLVRYPGFQGSFGVPIRFASRGGTHWITLPEINESLDERHGALELSRNIREAVAAVAAAGRAVVLILTPERWSRWRGFSTEQEVFDVHDFVKAYCVQRGIATQFLDQDTLTYPDKCRIWWWLSTAMYAKAMRTPWVLDGLDAETAFVGLGYAVNTRAERGRHIVVGCSHLYNAQGQGLQFRLSRVENPVMVGGNPFLGFEDARRLGENIRTLFWEAHLRLPRRVVIHKLTPFRLDEQRGLKAGLEGVEDLEMLEINFESALRYVSSQPLKNGGFEDAMFPVRRGTAVRLTGNEALLWVHGSTDAVKPRWTYFQGKRRIPGPVVVRRYAGCSDIATVVHETLGLSKMDWNSGDLYGKLPVTVQSSKRIARIGSLLDRFSTASYDYRLFM